MKNLLLAGALAASFVLSGCASNQGGAVSTSLGETEPGYIIMKDGKRQDTMVGSRVARETRENAESVKMISRKGYKDSQIEKSGGPLDGQRTGG